MVVFKTKRGEMKMRADPRDITQAALVEFLGCQFYNVPVQSDIYFIGFALLRCVMIIVIISSVLRLCSCRLV